MSKAFDYDVELDTLYREEKPETRENIDNLRKSIEKIQEIIDDIDRRLTEAGV